MSAAVMDYERPDGMSPARMTTKNEVIYDC